MAKQKHTEGPWEKSSGLVCGGKNPRRAVAIYTGNRNVRFASPEEQEANARLIAAAPDLLAAVEHVLIASEDQGTFGDMDFDMLRAAIAKAETK